MDSAVRKSVEDLLLKYSCWGDIEVKGMSDEEAQSWLDEIVRDVMDEEASKISNKGAEEQVKFIREKGW